jgi:signal transduction histidine kinase
VEPAHEVAELGERLLRFLVRARDQRERAVGVGVELLLRPPEVHAQRDEPLLGAVVQVAFDPAALGLGAVEGRGAAGVERFDLGLERVTPRRTEQVPARECTELPHRDRRPRGEQEHADRADDGRRDRGAVVARCPVPVTLEVDVPKRPSAPVENTIYFVVTEALANVAKHARATRASVSISARGDRLVVEIADNGIGGARRSPGSGLAGLAERVAAVGGRTQVVSPIGGPTSVFVEVPCAS